MRHGDRDLLEEDTGFSPRERFLILATATVVTTLYAMTVTIANVALPRIQGALSATTDEIALVVTFNIIATAVATPVSGWLAGRFSRRGVLLVAVTMFTVSTLFCGLSTDQKHWSFSNIARCVRRPLGADQPVLHRHKLSEGNRYGDGGF